MESVEEVKRKSKGKESRFGKRYGFELKLRCVKLRLEEGLPVSLLSKEAGVSKDVIYRWVKAYQERGEAGLRNQVRSSESRRKLPGPVREKMEVQMKKVMMLMFLFLLLSPIAVCAQNNGVSIGYGFSFLTPHQEIGEVKEDRKYNFEHFAYFHQWSIFRSGYIVLEPFVAYVNRPETGLEFGATLLLRYYIPTSEATSLYFNLGGGGAHSTVDFLEQGSRNFFILAGGIGFKWRSFFIENRFRHYSNAHLATPNDSVNANVIMIGFYF